MNLITWRPIETYVETQSGTVKQSTPQGDYRNVEKEIRRNSSPEMWTHLFLLTIAYYPQAAEELWHDATERQRSELASRLPQLRKYWQD